MSRQRLNITIDEELLKELKETAKIHCHSVSNEIEYRLKNSTQPFQLQFDNFKRTTPENPTGQTHTPTATTATTDTTVPTFQQLAKKIVGHTIKEEDCSLTPTNTYYDYAKEVPDKILRFATTLPYEKQLEYLHEYKHYDKQ